MSERLYRSRDDRMIAGVAGGLAERLDVDPALIRIVWAVLVIPTGFLALLVYIVAALVVPDEDDVPRPGVNDARHDPAGTGWPSDPAGTGWPAEPAGPPAPWTASYPVAPSTTSPWTAPQPVTAPQPAPTPPISTPAMPTAPVPQAPPPMTSAAGYGSRRARRRAERAARHRDHGRGTTSVIVGGGLIVLGCWFLFREYFPDLDASRFWPIAVVGFGVLLVIVALGRRSDAPDGDR
jgi:phage shock protein C